MSFPPACKKIAKALKPLPTLWHGKQAIREMKSADCRHWRQMEWMGFYFQFLCERYLKGIMRIPGPVYGKTGFDGLLAVPWDFKAHAANTSSHQLIVNDWEAIAGAIKEHGSVGLILAVGDVEYNDERRTFQRWHDRLKGKQSAYVRQRIARGAWSRLRKVSFALKEVSLIQIGQATLEQAGAFQRAFRNADGSPRRDKVLLDLENLGEALRMTIKF